MHNRAGLLAEGAAAFDAHQHARAEDLCHAVLMQQPGNPGALYLLGAIARRSGRLDLSVDCLQEALLARPKDAAVQQELGLAFQQLGQLNQAEAAFRAALNCDPNFQSALVNLGALLEETGRYEEALEICRRAELLAPDCPLTHYNLGNILRALACNDEAIAHFERAIALDPNFAKARWNLSIACLSAGNFERGWQEYEARETTGQAVFDDYSQPRWTGDDLRNKTLLIHAEQGIGDEILFASCYPDIIPRAKQTVLVCDPRLKTLFARSFPTTRVIGHRRRVDRKPPDLDAECDVQIPAGSVPQFVRPSTESFPNRKRFLVPDPVARREWLRRFEQLGPGPKIGMSWQAGGQPSERRRRTTPLELWRDVFAIPGVQFVNVQYGDAADDIAAAREQFGVTIHDWPHADRMAADPLVDLDAFAAKVAALDLVISVGNATVHMAGALGVTTWTILPLVPPGGGCSPASKACGIRACGCFGKRIAASGRTCSTRSTRNCRIGSKRGQCPTASSIVPRRSVADPRWSRGVRSASPPRTLARPCGCGPICRLFSIRRFANIARAKLAGRNNCARKSCNIRPDTSRPCVCRRRSRGKATARTMRFVCSRARWRPKTTIRNCNGNSAARYSRLGDSTRPRPVSSGRSPCGRNSPRRTTRSAGFTWRRTATKTRSPPFAAPPNCSPTIWRPTTILVWRWQNKADMPNRSPVSAAPRNWLRSRFWSLATLRKPH